jgi:fermentation-respiration switch protein FrsA (DUF1100 family)
MVLNVGAQNNSSEDITLYNGSIELPGTLTIPEISKKLPLVIFVAGSGNVDRNGNQAGTPIQIGYIKALADSLNANGLAFYRFDKRTATPANLDKLGGISLLDFVEDTKIAIERFKDDPRFSSLSLIGHSQGSLVAMLAITESVKSFISIAGPGTTIDKTLIEQLKKQNTDFGNTATQYFEELQRTDTIYNVNPLLRSLFAPQNQKFLKSWMLLDPSEAIKKITVPILILQGDADLQVSVENAEKLKQAQPNATLYIVPKMNHVLKVVNSLTENYSAYSDTKFPISRQLIGHITDFITKR